MVAKGRWMWQVPLRVVEQLDELAADYGLKRSQLMPLVVAQGIATLTAALTGAQAASTAALTKSKLVQAAYVKKLDEAGPQEPLEPVEVQDTVEVTDFTDLEVL